MAIKLDFNRESLNKVLANPRTVWLNDAFEDYICGKEDAYSELYYFLFSENCVDVTATDENGEPYDDADVDDSSLWNKLFDEIVEYYKTLK